MNSNRGSTPSRWTNSDGEQKAVAQVLVATDEYLPEVPMKLLRELDWTLTEGLLVAPEGPLVPNPGDYDTYAVEFTVGSRPRYGLLFVPMNTSVSREESYVLDTGGRYLTGDSGLIVTELRPRPCDARPPTRDPDDANADKEKETGDTS